MSCLLSLLLAIPVARAAAAPEAPAVSSPAVSGPAALEPVRYPPGFTPVRAVHLSAWVAGSSRGRRRFLDQMDETFLNAVVVPLKETEGEVFIPGVAKARELKTYAPAIPEPGTLVEDIHRKGYKAIARIVIFKDNLLAARRPELAVHRPDGAVWRNKKGVAWVDPYRREVWEYNVDIASAAVAAGFDEIQFDYIRFPSDGEISLCRYSRKDHSARSAVANVRDFLAYARERLRPLGVPFSVAVFGMTTTATTDMGIGQDLRVMAGLADYVSPMMYPSHYGRGEYGLANPNKEPYKVIFRGLRDARRRLEGDAWKLRPYLQDFSLGHRYGVFEVQAQLLASQRHGIESWILWNPSNRYTWQALKARDYSPVRFSR